MVGGLTVIERINGMGKDNNRSETRTLVCEWGGRERQQAEGVEKDRNSIYLLNPAAPITGEAKYNGLHDNSGDQRLQAASEQ